MVEEKPQLLTQEELEKMGFKSATETTQHDSLKNIDYQVIRGEVEETACQMMRRKGIKIGDSYSIDEASPAVKAALLGRVVNVTRRE